MSKNYKKTNVLIEQIIQFILLLPFFAPSSLEHLAPSLERMSDMYLIASCISILFIYFFVYRKASRIIIAIMSFELVQLLSTFINSGDYWIAFSSAAKVICFCMLIEVGIALGARLFLRALMIILGVLCLANLISILLYPNGMYTTLLKNNWILGYDNMHVLYILPFLCTFALYTVESHLSNFLKWSVLLIFSLSIYITWSATSVVGVTVWLVFFALSNLYSLRKIITNLRFQIIATVIVFFGIIILRLQNLIAFLIEGILKKSLTFTGRTRIWDSALNLFKENPIYGLGVTSTDVTRSYLHGASHCHNYFLQILYQSGLIGMACFIVVLILLIKPKKYSYNSNITYLLHLTIFCFLIMLQVEAYTYMTTFFGLVTMAYHSKSLEMGLIGAHPKKVMFVWNRKRLLGDQLSKGEKTW